MRLLPGPADLLRLPAHAVEAIGDAIALVPRVVALVGEAESLVGRAATLISSIEDVQLRASAAVTEVDRTRHRADVVVGKTEPVVDRAAAMVDRLQPLVLAMSPLLTRFLPVLEKLEPMVAQLVGSVSPGESAALARLIDVTPELAAKMRTDILPILDTLGTVAPDLRDLLDVSRELNEIIGAVPGFGRIKRKVEERQEQEDAMATHTANELPASSPDRR